MDYYKTIKISKERADFIKRALSEPGLMDDMASDGETTSFLDDLYLVDVKIVGCGDEEPCWTEAVLFKRNADGTYSEVSHTDVEDEFLGEWELCDHEGNSFIVTVEAEGQGGTTMPTEKTEKKRYRITFRSEAFVWASSPEEAEEIYGGYDLYDDEAKEDLDLAWVETNSVEEVQ